MIQRPAVAGHRLAAASQAGRSLWHLGSVRPRHRRPGGRCGPPMGGISSLALGLSGPPIGGISSWHSGLGHRWRMGDLPEASCQHGVCPSDRHTYLHKFVRSCTHRLPLSRTSLIIFRDALRRLRAAYHAKPTLVPSFHPPDHKVLGARPPQEGVRRSTAGVAGRCQHQFALSERED